MSVPAVTHAERYYKSQSCPSSGAVPAALQAIDTKNNFPSNEKKFTWSSKEIKKSELPSTDTLASLSQYLDFEATADHLLNWYLHRALDREIDENDPEIPVCFLIGWKKLKASPQPNSCLTTRVSWEELEAHLKKQPTALQHVNANLKSLPADLDNPLPNPILKRSIVLQINLKKNRDIFINPSLEEVSEQLGTSLLSWQDHCNILHQKPLDAKVTYQELVTYTKCFKSRSPTSEELFNWTLQRDLAHPISPEDDFLSLKDFQKLIPDAKWFYYFNYKKMRPFNAPTSLNDLQEYLKREPSLNERMNWVARRDLSYQNTEQDIDRHPWKLHVNLCIGQPNIHKFVKPEIARTWMGRELSQPQFINFYLERPLSSPISRESLEVFLGRAPTIAEVLNCREKQPLTLGKGLSPQEHYRLLFKREPTIKEMFNWNVNRDLNQTITKEDLASYFELPLAQVSQVDIDAYNLT